MDKQKPIEEASMREARKRWDAFFDRIIWGDKDQQPGEKQGEETPETVDQVLGVGDEPARG